ncbi:MAG: hypothetical protein JW966_12355, partial [Anaerolineae bacterium]|nr:hypothetical protein [Anaerolineae bacterium]
YVLPDVAYTPVALLPGALPCVVGAPSATAEVMMHVGPGAQRGAFGNMLTNLIYTVTGWGTDPEGVPWWQIDLGTDQGWVPEASVLMLGACDAVAEAETPPLTFAPPEPPAEGDSASDEADTGEPDMSPTANSVWQMYPGTDNMTGNCTGAPPINFCDHLAAIQPATGGIMWKGMEASPYYLERIQPNVYAYSGPNILGTGTINMTLTFTTDNTLKMTQGLTLASEPSCQHVYYYTGTRNW